MNNNRLISLALIAGSLAILLLGWFLGVSPILDQAAAANSQRDTAAASNVALEARTAALKDQFDNLSELEDELGPLSASVPFDGDVSAFLDRINALGDQIGVSLDSLTVGSAEVVTAGEAVDPAAEAPAIDAAPPTEDPATPAEPAPADTSTGLVSIPVTVVVKGGYAQTLAFLGALQNDSRLFLMKTVAVNGLTDGTPFTGTFDGWIFALPATAPVPAP